MNRRSTVEPDCHGGGCGSRRRPSGDETINDRTNCDRLNNDCRNGAHGFRSSAFTFVAIATSLAALLAFVVSVESAASGFRPTSVGHHIASPGFSGAPFGAFNRRRRPPACAHKGDAVNGVAARAYLASTVFEGKARSKSRFDNGVYSVTFVVQKVHKDAAATLALRDPVRLQFRSASGSNADQPTVLCRQSYNYTKRHGDIVRTNIKQGGKYIVFVSGVGPHNFTLVGEPVFKTSKNAKAVRDVLQCSNYCVKPVNVSGLKDTRVELGKKVRLVCRCRGHPQPALAWYKDGHPVRASNASRIEFRKKRTSLVIPKAKLEDAGRYECRATSVTGQVASAWANVTVTLAPALTTRAPSLSPYVPKKCPIEKYCLNGGTCALYDTVQELVCTCAEGYKGSRCENKDVYNQSSMYMSYFCKLGISSSYYC